MRRSTAGKTKQQTSTVKLTKNQLQSLVKTITKEDNTVRYM